MSCMYKIAVIGDKDSVYGFKALGAETYFVTGKKEAKELVRNLKDCAVIYITERIAEFIREELEELNQLEVPAVVVIPGVYGNTGLGMQLVRNTVIRAVGSDI